MTQKAKGLSLIELLIVVSVLAVAAAVGYPLYVEQVQKSRRNDAQGVLLALANEIEHHRATQPNVGYSGFAIDDFSEIWNSISSSYLFSVTLSSVAPFAYVLTAAPAGPQTGDRCGDLVLNEIGEKLAAQGSCWK
jgi:type IV pilus assembly protein PilE